MVRSTGYLTNAKCRLFRKQSRNCTGYLTNTLYTICAICLPSSLFWGFRIKRYILWRCMVCEIFFSFTLVTLDYWFSSIFSLVTRCSTAFWWPSSGSSSQFLLQLWLRQFQIHGARGEFPTRFRQSLPIPVVTHKWQDILNKSRKDTNRSFFEILK